MPAAGECVPYRPEVLKKAISRNANITKLCKSINISRGTFYRALNGENVVKDTIEAIGDALGVPAEKIFVAP